MSEAESIEIPDSRRPALRKFTNDLERQREQLLAGFESRRAVLQWAQKLTVRTLGEIPQSWYHALAREFAIDHRGQDGTFLNALLQPGVRTIDLSDAAARRIREQEYAAMVLPVANPAIRELRTDANEYVGEGEDPEHDPAAQRYIAMRPSLDDLDESQEVVLEDLLDGFDSREQIVGEWASELQHATHGEPVIPEAPGTFASRCYSEASTRDLLLGDTRQDRRAREHFAARWLLPAFNRGARDLAGRAGEQPETETDPAEAKMI